MTEPATYTEEQFRAAVDAAGRIAFDEGRLQGLEAARVEGHAEGYAKGVAQERARCRAILETPAARNNPLLARRCALTTDMTALEAAEFLDGLPPERTASRLDAAMAGHDPRVDMVDSISGDSQERSAGLGAAVARLLNERSKH